MTLICVPLIDGTIEGMFNTGVRCKEVGADLLEFRLDFINESIDESALTKLLHYGKQIGLPGIITIRPIRERGRFEGTEESRIEIIKKCINIGFNYVDLELNIENEKLAELLKEAKKNQVKTIISHHNFRNTPEQDKILETIKQCSNAGADIAKVVVNCNNYRDGINVLRAGVLANKLNLSFCIMGMGEFGSITRILSPAIGCKIVYASIDEKSKFIEGQIDVIILKEIWEILGYD